MNDPSGLLERVTIEPMGVWDLEQVAQIEKASFRRPWPTSGFQVELERGPAVCLVARDGTLVCGYLIFWVIVPEIHILNLAVRPLYRRQGLATLLLEYLFEYGRERGVTEVFLEVRPSNAAAQALYDRLGFRVTGRRRNYYAEDKEDAILMGRRLGFKSP
ncbi:MAG: ribosomal protein S18-alanine N-acetyltransferase [Thermodesulfobacteriota bacterium]